MFFVVHWRSKNARHLHFLIWQTGYQPSNVLLDRHLTPDTVVGGLTGNNSANGPIVSCSSSSVDAGLQKFSTFATGLQRGSPSPAISYGFPPSPLVSCGITPLPPASRGVLSSPPASRGVPSSPLVSRGVLPSPPASRGVSPSPQASYLS